MNPNGDDNMISNNNGNHNQYQIQPSASKTNISKLDQISKLKSVLHGRGSGTSILKKEDSWMCIQI